MSVATSLRFRNAGSACPVCGGFDRMNRDSSARCGGFVSTDGRYAHCTNSEYAGGLARENGGTFAHYLGGPCRCGVNHNNNSPAIINRPVSVPSSAGAAGGSPAAIVATYDYKNEKGVLLFQVCRMSPKSFKQRRPDQTAPGGWSWSLGDTRRVLYHLPELVADPKQSVFVVEGEKDVDRLRAGGLIATCNPGGVGMGWRDEYSDALHGRDVVIIPDNDDQGRVHAEKVKASTYRQARSVVVLTLAGLSDKGDVSDWLDQDGHTVAELVELARVALAQSQKPNATDQAATATGSTGSTAPKTINARDLVAMEFEPIRWAVPELLPAGYTMLSARPKIGKSWLVLNLAVAIAAGGVALGARAVEQGPVLYLALEDNLRRLKDRLLKVCPDGAIPEGLTLATEWPRADQDGIAHIETWLKANPNARLVVVDTLAKFRPPARRNGNIYAEDYASGSGLKRLADTYGVAIVGVHHNRKGTSDDPLEDVSGSTGLTAGLDNLMTIKRQRGAADAVLTVIGRDIPGDQELAIQFDQDTATWQLLGSAKEHAVSEARRDVLELLADNPAGLDPSIISRELGKERSAICMLLRAMLKDGQLTQDSAGGRYKTAFNKGGATGRPQPQPQPQPDQAAPSLFTPMQPTQPDQADQPDQVQAVAGAGVAAVGQAAGAGRNDRDRDSLRQYLRRQLTAKGADGHADALDSCETLEELDQALSCWINHPAYGLLRDYRAGRRDELVRKE